MQWQRKTFDHVVGLETQMIVTVRLLRLATGAEFPGWPMLLAPLFEALLWPLASWLLLVPQRRAPDPDENRPL